MLSSIPRCSAVSELFSHVRALVLAPATVGGKVVSVRALPADCRPTQANIDTVRAEYGRRGPARRAGRCSMASTTAVPVTGSELVAEILAGIRAERESFPAGAGRDGYADGAIEQTRRISGLLGALRRDGAAMAAETARQDAADHYAAAHAAAGAGGRYEGGYAAGAAAACAAVDRILTHTITAAGGR